MNTKLTKQILSVILASAVAISCIDGMVWAATDTELLPATNEQVTTPETEGTETETPDPGTEETPDQPETPDTPDKPETPDQPETPDKPDKPQKPEKPKPLKPHKVKANGTADSAIEYAKQYVGLKGLKAVKKRMKFHKYNIWYSGFYSEWCAWFVTNCAKQTGSGSKVGASIYVNDLAYQTVNWKGGKITFVNKHFYKGKRFFFRSKGRTLNTEYKPRKGDLIIYSKDGKFWWTHVGLVREDHDNPLKGVPTIEGNTANNNFTKALVAERVRTSRKGFRIVAYITPKYNKKKK